MCSTRIKTKTKKRKKEIRKGEANLLRARMRVWAKMKVYQVLLSHARWSPEADLSKITVVRRLKGGGKLKSSW